MILGQGQLPFQVADLGLLFMATLVVIEQNAQSGRESGQIQLRRFGFGHRSGFAGRLCVLKNLNRLRLPLA